MNTRKWVWQALEAICLEGAYSNLYLQQNLRQVKESDRALATQIVYGTLQNGRLLRWQWETKVRRMPSAPVALLLDHPAAAPNAHPPLRRETEGREGNGQCRAAPGAARRKTAPSGRSLAGARRGVQSA